MNRPKLDNVNNAFPSQNIPFLYKSEYEKLGFCSNGNSGFESNSIEEFINLNVSFSGGNLINEAN